MKIWLHKSTYPNLFILLHEPTKPVTEGLLTLHNRLVVHFAACTRLPSLLLGRVCVYVGLCKPAQYKYGTSTMHIHCSDITPSSITIYYYHACPKSCLPSSCYRTPEIHYHGVHGSWWVLRHWPSLLSDWSMLLPFPCLFSRVSISLLTTVKVALRWVDETATKCCATLINGANN